MTKVLSNSSFLGKPKNVRKKVKVEKVIAKNDFFADVENQQNKLAEQVRKELGNPKAKVKFRIVDVPDAKITTMGVKITCEEVSEEAK